MISKRVGWAKILERGFTLVVKVGVQIRQLLREYITLEQFQKKVEYITPTIQYFFATEKAINLLHHE
mgnify:FL=1